ncbi:hypothetical protein [Streptomyces sp. NPDC046985]|uniref:hypothetical protein n=1 Tax=Streptomyces sp. NPDC046985 TaxID=3155377 RepID=UPI0033C5CD6C
MNVERAHAEIEKQPRTIEERPATRDPLRVAELTTFQQIGVARPGAGRRRAGSERRPAAYPLPPAARVPVPLALSLVPLAFPSARAAAVSTERPRPFPTVSERPAGCG